MSERRRPDHWVFGYGSLIWNPGFPHRERLKARLSNFARRFYQGSSDHRGTPASPGRVVTLLSSKGEHCDGVVYRVDDVDWPQTLSYLDKREQGGYERVMIQVQTQAGTLSALTYVGQTDNPDYLGPAPLEAMAQQIAQSSGPSGLNRDYLGRLRSALTDLRVCDAHVEALWSEVSQRVNQHELVSPSPDA